MDKSDRAWRVLISVNQLVLLRYTIAEISMRETYTSKYATVYSQRDTSRRARPKKDRRSISGLIASSEDGATGVSSDDEVRTNTIDPSRVLAAW